MFIHFDSNRPFRGFHETRQTCIKSDIHVFIHFDSNRPIRGFHKTRQALINFLFTLICVCLYILIVKDQAGFS